MNRALCGRPFLCWDCTTRRGALMLIGSDRRIFSWCVLWRALARIARGRLSIDWTAGGGSGGVVVGIEGHRLLPLMPYDKRYQAKPNWQVQT